MVLDASVSFGLSTARFAINEISLASLNSGGQFVPERRSQLEQVPLAHRTNTHVTLHPAGACHVRVTGAPPIVEYSLAGWHPVKERFLWLHAYTAPVSTLPRVSAQKLRDAVVNFPSGARSARIQADIFPREPNIPIPLEPTAVDTLIGIGPDYMLRLAVFQHTPVQAGLALTRQISAGKAETTDA
jgi:hypothetical protein